MTKENVMKSIVLEKITLNMGAGESGPKLDRCKRIMEKIAGTKVVITKTHRRGTFGVAKKKPIGVKVTLRGDSAMKLLERLLGAKNMRLNRSNFDDSGNFSFGVEEYIHIPGIRYDPDVGILGLDVSVTLERPGFRVKRRRMGSRIGSSHRITREEAMEWAKKKLNAEIVEKEETVIY